MMMLASLPQVAPEGRLHIACALAFALLASALLGGWIAALAWAAVLLTVRFFQVSHRTVPAAPGAVVCPVDGRVLRIEEMRDPHAGRNALRIRVGNTIPGMLAGRSSVDGTVVHSLHSKGAHALVLDAHGVLVTLVRVARRLPGSDLCRVKTGDVLTRGQCYGGRRLGAATDVYLPAEAVLRVRVGDKVSATTTILATLPPA